MSAAASDNPFRPGGDLDKEADDIIKHSTIQKDRIIIFDPDKEKQLDGGAVENAHTNGIAHNNTTGAESSTSRLTNEGGAPDEASCVTHPSSQSATDQRQHQQHEKAIVSATPTNTDGEAASGDVIAEDGGSQVAEIKPSQVEHVMIGADGREGPADGRKEKGKGCCAIM